jgi:hypothetical protein
MLVAQLGEIFEFDRSTYNLMVYSVAALEVGSLLVTYLFALCLLSATFGTVQERFSVTYSLVLMMTLMTKLSSVNTKNLVTNHLREAF